MPRIPNTGPAERDRQKQIRRLERLLRELERVPAHRRDDECADVRERDVRQFLAEFGAPGYDMLATTRAAVEIVDIEELIEELRD